MKYFSDELNRRKFSDIAYYAYCTVHDLNELIIVETKNKYIVVEFEMLAQLYKNANTVMRYKWHDKAVYLNLI
jgi:hypothetical protein